MSNSDWRNSEKIEYSSRLILEIDHEKVDQSKTSGDIFGNI